MSAAAKTHALLAEFETPAALLAGARRVRDAGFTKWDAHSPFPVHGIDEAVGIRPTKLPWLVFGGGLAGCLLALWMQWWMNAVDYPYVASGKPLFSLPANIPIIFELTVLLAALTAVFGMLAFNGLPQLHNALFRSTRFRRVTSDRFFICIEAADPRFNASETQRFLESLGGPAVERIEDGGTAKLPRWMVRTAVIVGTLALIPLALIAQAWYGKFSERRIHPIVDMDNQEKFRAQQAHPLFADGRAMRPPVGATSQRPLGLTVARGELRDDPHFFAGKVGGEFVATFPPSVEVNMRLMKRGRERFEIYCAPCHGRSGVGDGPVALRAAELAEPTWVAPASLHEGDVTGRSVGHLFNSITNGIRTMPAYGDQIAERDRWAIVAYVKALQRAQNARVEDVPAETREILEQR